MINSSLTKEIKLLTFGLDNDIYGINILLVRQVLRMKEVEFWPIMSAQLIGLKYFFQYQDSLVPLIDMKIKIGLQSGHYTTEMPILILERKEMLIAFVVDEVYSVDTSLQGNLQRLNNFYFDTPTPPFSHAYLREDSIICMLDIQNIFNASDIDNLNADIKFFNEQKK